MDRRFLTVLGVSLVFALVVSSVFYQMTARSERPPQDGSRPIMRDMVVTTRPLGVGVMVKPADVKIVKIRGRGVSQGRVLQGRRSARPAGDFQHSAGGADPRRPPGGQGQRTGPGADHSGGHARGHGARQRRRRAWPDSCCRACTSTCW